MKTLSLALFALTSVQTAHAASVHCAAGDHVLNAHIDQAASTISYQVSGPGYSYDGFENNAPGAVYQQQAAVKNSDTLDFEADLTKTVIVDYLECLEFKKNSRACAKYSNGPHPHTTLHQAFFLRMKKTASGLKVGYFSIYNANPEFPGGYMFKDLDGASCEVQL